MNYLMRKGAWVYHDIPYKYGNIDHVVVSTGGVFVVETKAYRKPASNKGRADANVEVINGELKFPACLHQTTLRSGKTTCPLYAAHLHKRLGIACAVTPVVALPGWYVKQSGNKPKVLVINPKRGMFLEKYVSQKHIMDEEAERIATSIEEFARDVHNNADDRYDPDARKRFSFWLNRKYEKREL